MNGVVSIWEASLPWLRKAAGDHILAREERESGKRKK